MLSVIPIFWKWYYGKAINNILNGWKNFILFALEYFSIPLLFKTLFAPWKRDITKKPKGFNFKKIFEYFSFNLISIAIGFFIRFLAICVGILFLFLVIILGAILFILWLCLPLIFIVFLILAIIFIL